MMNKVSGTVSDVGLAVSDVGVATSVGAIERALNLLTSLAELEPTPDAKVGVRGFADRARQELAALQGERDRLLRIMVDYLRPDGPSIEVAMGRMMDVIDPDPCATVRAALEAPTNG